MAAVLSVLRDRVDFAFTQPVKAHLRRCWKRRQLEAVRVREQLAASRVVAVVTVRNESHRMAALLRHYRRLGVDHFIVIDNESSDSLVDDLESAMDVSLYRAVGDYASARYGVDWVNAVLSRHCRDKWVLFVDADEFVVYDSTLRDLTALCEWLERSGRESLQALMLDMYSRRPAAENVVRDGQDPLEVCDLFDTGGYERQHDPASDTTWIKGGVRGRLFFPNRWDGPALNKTPLVRWRRHYAFLRSAHLLWPRRLNGGSRTPELALLHFKFTPSSAALMADAEHRASHTSEYLAYDSVQGIDMVGPETDRYRCPSDLTGHGLLARTGPLA